MDSALATTWCGRRLGHSLTRHGHRLGHDLVRHGRRLGLCPPRQRRDAVPCLGRYVYAALSATRRPRLDHGLVCHGRSLGHGLVRHGHRLGRCPPLQRRDAVP